MTLMRLETEDQSQVMSNGGDCKASIQWVSTSSMTSATCLLGGSRARQFNTILEEKIIALEKCNVL